MNTPNRFTKIKHEPKSGAVFLAWENDHDGKTDVYSFKCEETPTPEFLSALSALKADVIRVCDLPDDYANGMIVRGVSISHAEKMSVVFTALKTVDLVDAPFVINTPGHPPRMARLEPLMAEAQKYLMGERAQGTLPLEGAA